MATYTDDFNRADEASLGGDWGAELGVGLGIVNNAVRWVSGQNLVVSSLSALTFDDDQSAEIKYTNYVNYDNLGVGVRWNGSGSGYVVMAEDGGVYILRFDAGVPTNLASVGQAFGVNDVLGISITGSNISVTKNGVEFLTDTDSTYSSGSPAIYYTRGNNNGTTGDDFSATGLSAAPSAVSVDGDDIVYVGQENIVAVTTGIPASLTSWTPYLGSEAQIPVSRSGDNFTFSMNPTTNLTTGNSHTFTIQYQE